MRVLERALHFLFCKTHHENRMPTWPFPGLFCEQNMSIVRIKVGFLPTFLSFQGILVCESCESFLLVEMHYYWTFSKKDHEFEISAMEGTSHIFWEF
jgi:hypothetical protein